MAKKEINVKIAAKNALAKGLGEAKASLKKFGESAKRIAGFFAKGFLAAGAAVAGFVTKSLAAYAQQEQAERSLIAAMNAHNEAGESLLPMLRRKADAIQKETGVADEATLAGMARMRMLGVQIDQMDHAAKGVIALTRAGMGQEAAERAMAAALQGNVSMLTRYLPALRGVTDAAEQQRIVNEFLTRGYESQMAELDTLSGRWGALKGSVGDMWEEFGRAISQNDLVVEALARAQDAVEQFKDMVVDWVDGGGVQNLIAGFQLFWAEVTNIWNMTSSSAHVAFSAIGDGAESAINYVVGIFKTWMKSNIDSVMAQIDVFKSLWEAIRNPGRESFQALLSSARDAGTAIVDVYRNVGDEIVNGYEEVTHRTEAALHQREAYQQEHADRIAGISQRQLDALMAHDEERTAAAKAAAEAEIALAEGVSQSIIDRAQETTREKLNEIRTRLRAEHEAGNDVIEVAKEIFQGGRQWAHELTASLMAEIDTRVESEEEAAELKRQIQEQLSADIGEIHRGLTEIIRQEQQQRVENEKEAAGEMVKAHQGAADAIGNIQADAGDRAERGGLGRDGGRRAGAAFGSAWNQAWNSEVGRVLDGLGFGGGPGDFGGGGRGFDSSPISRSDLSGAGAFGGGQRVDGMTEAILRELEEMNRNQTKLLTWGGR